jgi:hypothetical protein
MRTSVRRITPSIAVLTLVLAGSAAAMAREGAAHPSQVDQQVANVPPVQLIIGGVVRRVLGSGVFILDDTHATDRELMVLVPGAEATPVAGASVVVRGLFRRFDEAELEQIRVWNELDEQTREAFGPRPILLATSLTTASGRSLMARTSPTVKPLTRRLPIAASRPAAEIQMHPASLAELIDEVGGRPVVLPRARVLAVVNPRVLLIESASLLLATIGNLDRVLVLIEDGALRVDAAALTDENVRVVGVARTLLGVKVTGEVAWPAELTQDMVERLEIRAAVLATSVHTADGVELTDRQTHLQK